MIDDRERKLLVEIERGLLREAPELVRVFGTATPNGPGAHHHHAVIGKVAGLTLCAVLLIGPRVLTTAEVATRGAPGPPRVAPAPPGTPRSPCRRPRFRTSRGELHDRHDQSRTRRGTACRRRSATSSRH